MNQISQASSTYLILDSARVFGELNSIQSLQSNFLSLFIGSSAETLSSVAPYLFRFQHEADFAKWYLEKGWGNSCGVFLQSSASIEELHSHLRRFLMVRTEEGQELFFRFYDPRVLRQFLPTCTQAQLTEFFGPITMFLVEAEDAKSAITFILTASGLEFSYITKPEVLDHLNNHQIQEEPKFKSGAISSRIEVANTENKVQEKKRNFFIE